MWLDQAGHYWEKKNGSQWYYLDGDMQWRRGKPAGPLTKLPGGTQPAVGAEPTVTVAPDGTKVLRGERGPIGATGATGPVGPTGSTGPVGAAGPPGPTGPMATAPHILVAPGDATYTLEPPARPADGYLVMFEILPEVDTTIHMPAGVRLTAGMTPHFDLLAGQHGFVGLRWSDSAEAWYALAVTVEREDVP